MIHAIIGAARSLLSTACLLAALCMFVTSAVAQAPNPNSDPEGYDAWKQRLVIPGASEDVPGSIGSESTPMISSEDLLVPFPGDGGWSFLPKNDDASTGMLPLGFDFTLYGTQYNQVCVNNNGNISFINCFGTFTPVGFPSALYRMVAPFWADVDTRCAQCGLAYYKTLTFNGRPAFVAHFEAVGYFSNQSDKLNTFQVLITDEAVLPGQNNVCFDYGDMEWTTGSASGGVGGFGGSPATVGANAGDGTNFFLYGRFDKPGTDYDGPGGDTDGVGHLTGQTICFNTGASLSNIPPVVSSAPSSPINVAIGGAVSFSVTFIPPELDQIVTLASTLPSWLSCTLTNSQPGGTATASCSGTPTEGGTFAATIEATDDGTPPLSTTVQVSIVVDGPPVDQTPPECGPIVLEFEGPGGALSAINSYATDPESGIASVLMTSVQNLEVLIEGVGPYVQGDTHTTGEPNPETVTIRGERISFATGGRLVVRVYNGVGLWSYCDPVVAQLSSNVPDGFELSPAYPNPVMISGQPVQIQFAVAEPGPVALRVFDVAGREVMRLVDHTLEPGQYEVTWDGTDTAGRQVASGVYVYRLEAGPYSKSLSLTIVR